MDCNAQICLESLDEWLSGTQARPRVPQQIDSMREVLIVDLPLYLQVQNHFRNRMQQLKPQSQMIWIRLTMKSSHWEATLTQKKAMASQVLGTYSVDSG